MLLQFQRNMGSLRYFCTFPRNRHRVFADADRHDFQHLFDDLDLPWSTNRLPTVWFCYIQPCFSDGHSTNNVYRMRNKTGFVMSGYFRFFR